MSLVIVCLDRSLSFSHGLLWDGHRHLRLVPYACRLPASGARVFNAVVAANVSLERMLRGVDSASICFSKGLGCPVGSVVVGDSAFIHRVKRARKMVGGGMRQSGILAAAGLYALEHTVPLLHNDHRRTKTLAIGLATLPGIHVDVDAVETNMVFFKISPEAMDTNEFLAGMSRHGVHLQGAYHSTMASKGGSGLIRAVLHLHVTDEDVSRVVDTARSVLAAH